MRMRRRLKGLKRKKAIVISCGYVAECYGCPDPFAVAEMEKIAIANNAECFDMPDRIIFQQEKAQVRQSWKEYV